MADPAPAATVWEVSDSSALGIPPGWYRDPSGAALERYFDGSSWTEQTRAVQLRPRAPRPVEPVPPAAAAHPAATPSVTPQASVFGLDENGMPSFPASARRRSLTDALASSSVAASTSQRMLLGTAAVLPPRALRASSGPSPAGWYPDPARGHHLRFFDGLAWTARTRVVDEVGPRHLPQAARALRAAYLAAQDAASVRKAGQPMRRKVARTVIPRADAAPSLRGRTRSGSLWGMLSSLLVAAACAAALLFAWDLWGSDYWNTYTQADLEAELDQTTVDPSGWVPPAGAPEPSPMPTSSASPTDLPAPVPGTDMPRQEPPATRTPTVKPTRTTRPSASTSAPQRGPNTSRDGRPVGRITIPAIGLERVFVLGTSKDDLSKGPGVWKWGAFPGTPGNTTISGHRNTHGKPFHELDKLKYGDRIYIDVPGQPRAVYEMRGRTISDPFNVRVTRQTSGVRLTLTTCDPVGSAAQRLVIQSELVQGKYLSQALPRGKWRVMK